MPGVSNGKFLPLLPAPPLPGIGWTVNVIAHTDLYAYSRGLNPPPLARVTRYQELMWSPEIGDTGAGSITLALADPLFSYALADGRTPDSLWRFENLWVVFEDGQWRGEFFGTPDNVQHAGSSEAAGRTVKVAGPGSGWALHHATVLSPYYPKPPPKGAIGVYQFKNQPVMSSWLTLLAAAQRRGAIPYVRPKFSATKDSGGTKWEDTPAPKPANTATATLGQVNFSYDSSALTEAGQKAVTALAGKIAKITYPVVTVTGHASSEGSRAYNYQKGLDRANTVRNAILAIRPLAQITAVSKGEDQPVASNSTSSGRAKNRRVVVTYQTASAYVDTIYTPERGTNLLDLLQQLTSGQTTAANRGPIHCEWIMGKQFELQVRSQIGVDRSRAVVYRDGSTCVQARNDKYSREDIANVIAVQNDSGVYKVATHPASIKKWGMREAYTRLEGSYATAVHAQIANTIREAYCDESKSMTIKVILGAPGTPRPFRDFGLGDWIGIWRSRGKLAGAVDKQRVVAITVTVGADGVPEYELTLDSTRTTRVKWLQLQINALTTRKRGIRTFFQDDTPTGMLPGDFWTPPQVTQ